MIKKRAKLDSKAAGAAGEAIRIIGLSFVVLASELSHRTRS